MMWMGGGMLVMAFFAFLIWSAFRDEPRERHWYQVPPPAPVHRTKTVRSENAEAILDKRYARGEMNRGEYLRMKEDLKKNR